MSNDDSSGYDGLDLPFGFDDAPPAVQLAVLTSFQSVDLVSAIRQELTRTEQSDYPSPALKKSEKAMILLRLRDHRSMLNESGKGPDE